VQFDQLLSNAKRFHRNLDEKLFRKAYEFAEAVHVNQSRLNGEPFIYHPMAVTDHLVRIKVDSSTLAAALLHDTMENTDVNKALLIEEFGQTVADLVDGVTVIKSIKTKSGERQYQESIRKLLLASAKDIRVVLIRLAEKLHNLETIEALPKEQQEFTLAKVFDIYAPLAERLGVYYLRWQLQDRAFAVQSPELYQQIEDYYQQNRSEREELIRELSLKMKQLLAKEKIDAEIKGRVKGHYSVYRKYLAKRRSHESLTEFLQRLHDKLALMILVDSIEQCYQVLGIVHRHWRHIPEEFDDYIANPKPNGYRSIQTAVLALPGERIEVQIKTKEMHEYNEFGPAAHVHYKSMSPDKGSRVSADEARVAWLKDLVEWHDEIMEDQAFEEAFRIDVFGDRVFVLTPKGDVKDLPKGSTPIDFAYAVHTEVGNNMVGAKVNGKVVSLDYQLQSNDICEIITSKRSKGPNPDWIKLAKRPYTKRLSGNTASWSRT